MPVFFFPFWSVRCSLVAILNKCEHMRQLMQQGDQEAVGVKIGIDAYSVFGMFFGGSAVVSKNAFALMRK